MERHILCNKQPILDQNQTLWSHTYSLEPIGAAQLTDQAWQDEAQDLFKELDASVGLDTLAGPNYCFYRAPHTLLATRTVPPLSDPGKLVIEFDKSLLKHKGALEGLKALAKAGHSLCLADYEPDEVNAKLLPIAKFVKLNRKQLGERLADVHAALKDSHTVIVTHVEDEAQFQQLRDQGIELFQGFYFTNPVITADKELGANEASMLQLLAEINKDDTDFDKLADIISTDVALSHHLLSAINHPSNDLPRQVESIEDAVKLMGLKRLKFWVSVMLLSSATGVPTELLTTSLVRAKFLEVLAEHTVHKNEKDSYFLVGLFSTLNAFFHLPMVDLVNQLPLSEPMKKALTDMEGAMGQALRIVRDLEQGSTDWSAIQFEDQDIMNISMFYLTANTWAQQILGTIR
ncbi:EAL and HDOD domain-containing protein [Sulfurivirga sp.]|uniref:EAL and HDOD domain-containing protein n=1 Tax=Sulfurivirga sp. TaxID=2614236 RepID=UPI0025F5220D|nr:HDOD domain-containing protein [Sulfurivirga sp.]